MRNVSQCCVQIALSAHLSNMVLRKQYCSVRKRMHLGTICWHVKDSVIHYSCYQGY